MIPYDQMPKHPLEVTYTTSVVVMANRCRGCDGWLIDPDDAEAQAKASGLPVGFGTAFNSDGGESKGLKWQWARKSKCFSDPVLGYFCPTCSANIGTQLAQVVAKWPAPAPPVIAEVVK